VLGIGEGDVCFSTTKLFHAYGLGNSLSFPFWVGATTVQLYGRPAPDRVLDTVERHRPTLLFSVPTLYNAMLATPEAKERDLSSVRLCVSAAESLPAEIWRRWHDTYGLTILDGIGSTEMLHIFCSNTTERLRPGSSGVAVPGYDLKLLGDTEEPVAQGDTGNLYVRGDSALAAYWRQHEKTKRTVLGDWVWTGDRYRQDADGFWWHQGRVDDMLKVGGLWVSPVEMEQCLAEHPAVYECAVVQVLVDGLTRIKAVVVCREADPARLTPELQDWCKQRLQRHEYPHIVEYAEELPKTTTGKIQRFKLREAAG
jgi:benzoate-CoA ligase family protein